MLTVILGLLFLEPDRPEAGGHPGKPDLGGAILLVVGTAMLATGIVQAGAWGWTDPLTVTALVVAPASLAMVVRRSTNHPRAILDLSLYRIRYYGRGNLMAFLIAGNFAGTYLALVTLLTGAWAMGTSAAGAALALVPLIGGPMSFVSGRLADHYGHRRLLVPGGACLVAGALWFRSGVGPEPDMGLWFPAIALYALGVGLAHANSASLAMRYVPGPSLGQAGATNRIMTEIGSVCSVAVTIALLVGADDPVEGVRRVMLLLALAGLVSMVVAAGVDTRPASDEVSRSRVSREPR